MGITDQLWWLFKNWLSDSSCCILLNGDLSDAFSISRSIKQGGMLSMFFYVASNYDIHDFVNNENTGLKVNGVDISSPTLADDTVLLSNKVDGLNVMINKAFLYSRMWRIIFSETKTKCMVFGETKYKNEINMCKRKWYMGTKSIEEVSHIIHVGNKLCSYNSTKERTDDVCKKGYTLLAGLTAIGMKSNMLSPTTSSTLWQKVCIPSILFSSEVWGKLNKTQTNKLEQLQVHVAKRVQGLHWRTHNEIARGMLGWFTVEGYINYKKLMFIHKLLSLSDENLCKTIFIAKADNTDDNSITSDLINVCKHYDLCNETTLVNDISAMSKISWKSRVKSAIYHKENVKWINGLNEKADSSRLLNVQHNLKVNNIYNVIRRNPHSQKELLMLARAMSSPVSDYVSICNMCQRESNDGLEHFLMYCTKLNGLREEMWEELINTHDVETSMGLFSLPDEDILNIFLSGDWVTEHVTLAASDHCICTVAQTFKHMLKMSQLYL